MISWLKNWYTKEVKLPKSITTSARKIQKIKLVTLLPYLALLVAHIIWGTNYVVAKITLQEFPPMSLAFARFCLAFILLVPFLVFERKKLAIKAQDLPKLFGVGMLITTLNIAFVYQGILRTSVTNASGIMMIVPALSVLIGWLILKEHVFTINVTGLIAGLLGTVILSGLPLFLLGISDPQVFLGNLFMILAALSWVVGLFFSKQLHAKYSSLAITAVAFLVAIICFAPPALLDYLENPQWINHVSIVGLAGLLYIALMSSVVGYFLIEWSVGKMPVSRAALFQYVEPFIATTLGVSILGDRISYSFIVGAILIGLGVYWGTLGKEEHHRLHRAHRI